MPQTQYEVPYDSPAIYEECVPDPLRPGVWTIPGYIAYSMGQVKGVDNLAFHDGGDAIPSVNFTGLPTTPVKVRESRTPTPPARDPPTTKATLKRRRFPLRMWTLHITRTPTNSRRAITLLVVLFTAVTLLVATIAVVLYLTVGGGLVQLRSSKQVDSSVLGNQLILGSFRILNQNFSVEYNDVQSESFGTLRKAILLEVDNIFKHSFIAADYNHTDITSFKNGSIIVNIIVHLKRKVREANKQVSLAFQGGLLTQSGQKHLGKFLVDFPSIHFSVSTAVPKIAAKASLFPLKRNMTLLSSQGEYTSTTLPSAIYDSTPSSTPTPSTSISTSTNSIDSSTESPSAFSSSTSSTDIPSTRLYMSSTTWQPLLTWFPFSTDKPSLPPETSSQIGQISYDASWSSWSSWSECEFGSCDSNQTQVRTRECRLSNDSLLNDTKACSAEVDSDVEVRDCPCSNASITEPIHVPVSTALPVRLCNECLDDELCLALHKEAFPICRKPKNPQDPLACKGWCNHTIEYCLHLGNNSYQCVDDRACLPNEWQCQDGLCVPESKRCDGHFNCFDMTDEYNCECAPGYIHCGNNTSCVHISKQCDGVVDCWDGKDEANCTKPCGEGYVPCNQGGCILSHRLCDGIVDCDDSSDEPSGCVGFQCLESEFTCDNGRCLPTIAQCDGFDQCGDKSDEKTCLSQASFGPLIPRIPVGCSPSHFSCGTGTCIEASAHCNGHIDCSDASDEHGCSQECKLICDNMTCIMSSQICNGVRDCVDGRDESCFPKCIAFQCTNGHCIDYDDLCDAVNDCGDFSDERECVYHSHYDQKRIYYRTNYTSSFEAVNLEQIELLVLTDNGSRPSDLSFQKSP